MSKNLFEQLFIDCVHFVTKIRKNMKNSLMLIQEKILLCKRALIKTIRPIEEYLSNRIYLT